MGKAYKILVTGAFNSGKTAFVSAASEIPVVTTERRITDDQAQVKEVTTVAMDYGQAKVGDDLLHLYGTPGQERFEFMWDILAREADALLVLVDSTDGSSLTMARRMLRRLRRKRRGVPFLVAATKQDGRRPMSPQRIADSLDLDADIVFTCDAREERHTKQILRRLSQLLS
ncbi:MAG: ATP/GTP-binding protein [Anaerolineae bacterium]|jgi:small GTP-binding protein